MRVAEKQIGCRGVLVAALMAMGVAGSLYGQVPAVGNASPLPGLLCDDFDEGSFAGPFADTNGSSMKIAMEPNGGGTGGHLTATYHIVNGGFAGMWAKVGKSFDKKQDWTKASAINLRICVSKPVDFAIIVKVGDRKLEGSFPVTEAGKWVTVKVPFKDFNGIGAGLGQVGDFDLTPLTTGDGWYAIDEMRVEGATGAQQAVEEKVEMDSKVIFAKTLTPPAERSNKVYIVDAAKGDDGNPGTEAKPFRTIQKAADQTLPGDTVLVKNGTYREHSVPDQAGVKITRSGAPDAWITFKAYPGHSPRITSPTWCTFRGDEVAYIELNGFDVTTEVVQHQTGDNKDRNSGNGIGFSKSHHIRLLNNRVHDCGGGGIATGFCDYLTVEGNTADHNAFWCIYNCSGISLWEGRDLDDGPGFHNVIRRNVSFANENRGPTPLYGSQLTDGNGIIIDFHRANAPILIENNVCYLNGGRGIHVFNARNVLVRNNTVAFNCFSQYGDADLRANTSRNVRFINNICVAAKGQKFVKNWKGNDIAYQSNLFYAFYAVEESMGAGNIIGQDPQFVQMPDGNGKGDLRVMSASPAVNAGSPDSQAEYDFTGKLRSTGGRVDIGAFEQ
jgi:parallel beta-helix repeat protein